LLFHSPISEEKNEKMRMFLVLSATVLLTLPAFAGTISGQVSGVNGESVVYVDTIAGKTFPLPPLIP
jgi:hypothetical protein